MQKYRKELDAISRLSPEQYRVTERTVCRAKAIVRSRLAIIRSAEFAQLQCRGQVADALAHFAR
jgi:hypothetical protein